MNSYWQKLKTGHWTARLLIILLSLILAVQVIRLIYAIITPVGQYGDWQPKQNVRMTSAEKAKLFSSFDPFLPNRGRETSGQVTSLQLTLHGVRMNEGSGMGSAIIAGPDGIQNSIATGEEISAGVSLSSVEFDHVVISRDGIEEKLFLDMSVPAESIAPQNGPDVSAIEPLVSAEDTVSESQSDTDRESEPADDSGADAK